jgi:hypothetical protein
MAGLCSSGPQCVADAATEAGDAAEASADATEAGDVAEASADATEAGDVAEASADAASADVTDASPDADVTGPATDGPSDLPPVLSEGGVGDDMDAAVEDRNQDSGDAASPGADADISGPSDASPTDLYNTFAPAMFADTDGTWWTLVNLPGTELYKIHSTYGEPWQRMNNPPGGLESGLVGAAFGPPKTKVIMGVDQGAVQSSTDLGTTWSTYFGAPLNGIGSSVAVAGIPGGEGAIALLDGALQPWWRRQELDGTLEPWTQVGDVSLIVAPGIAMNGDRIDIIGVQPGGRIFQQTCSSSSCFSASSTWTEIPGNFLTDDQANACWFEDTAAGGSWSLAVVARGRDSQAWVNIYDDSAKLWSGWQSRGGWFIGAISIVKPLNGGMVPMLVGQSNDRSENYLFSNVSDPSPIGWHSVTHP